MANNMQQQNLSLSGGNDAQKRYLGYYSQIKQQLGSSYTPTPIQAQVIQAPEKLTAQQLDPYTPIEAQQIALEDRQFGDYADEAASYLSKYLDNSIAARRRQTAEARAAADVDAYSRGFGAGSSWLTDAKLRLANQEAADITAAQNEFLGKVGEIAYGSMEAQRARNWNALLHNAEAQDAIAQFNASMQSAYDQWNKSAQTEVDKLNLQAALDVAMQNAQFAQQADMYNSQMQTEWEQYLQQLAWGWAEQMYGTNPVTRTVVKEAPQEDLGGVEINFPDIPARKLGKTPVSTDEWRNYSISNPGTRGKINVSMTK